MRTFTSWSGLPDAARGASVAIGNFDGVHLGHQAVMELARKPAEEHGRPFGIVTFEPHPRTYFAPEGPPFRLMNAEAKANRLAKLGVEVLYELPFDARIAELPPEAFARAILHDGLGIRHIVIGADFRFGKGRAGSARTMQDLGDGLGFEVTVAEIVTERNGEVSSTNIRRALSEGRPGDAARMLGHWHRIEGEVVHGEKRGRTLGYPTANMSIEHLHPPRYGVYAVKVDVLTGPHRGSYDGAASIGVRPMFGENRPNLETYIFDFDGDLYGAHLSVALVEFLRPEVRFDGVDALVAQMEADCRAARSALAD